MSTYEQFDNLTNSNTEPYPEPFDIGVDEGATDEPLQRPDWQSSDLAAIQAHAAHQANNRDLIRGSAVIHDSLQALAESGALKSVEKGPLPDERITSVYATKFLGLIAPDIFLNRSKRETEERQKAETIILSYEIAQKMIERIKDGHGAFSFATVGTNGGCAKTTVMVSALLAAAQATGFDVLYNETNDNDGTAHYMLGIPREDTMLYPEAVQNPDRLRTKFNTMEELGKRPNENVYAILSDPSNEAYDQLTLRQTTDHATKMREHFAIVGHDPGNNLRKNEAAFLDADVPLFTVNVDNVNSFSTALTTMKNLEDLGHIGKIRRYSRMVLSNTGKGDKFSAYEGELQEAAYSMARTEGRKDWINNPMRVFEHLGYTAINSSEELKLDKRRIDLLSKSRVLNRKEPVSILSEQIGPETLNDALRIVLNSLSMPVQPKKDRESELERRIKETDPLRVVTPGMNATFEDKDPTDGLNGKSLDAMSDEEIATYMKRMAAIKAARKHKRESKEEA